MKEMQIFEPAMCCSTGLCGVGVDEELLRISTVLNTLEKKNIKVERFNLSSAPQEFISNKTINDLINSRGVEELPATLIDGVIVLTGRYPTNDDLADFLEVPGSYLGNSGGCGCSGGGCC